MNDPEAINLAEHALYFARHYQSGVVFGAPLFELAQKYLLDRGIRYWIAPDGGSITCVTCGLQSYNPNDVAHLYCGNCKKFHGDEPKSS